MPIKITETGIELHRWCDAETCISNSRTHRRFRQSWRGSRNTL